MKRRDLMHPSTVILPLPTIDLLPTLLRTYAYNLDKKDWSRGKFSERIIDTYEFEFIIHSEGFMNLEGKKYPLKPGDLCFRRPGEYTQGEPPYSCYMISFSLSKDTIGQTKRHPFFNNSLLDAILPVISTKNPKYFELLFQKILEQYIKNDDSSMLMIRSLILEIIYAAYQEVGQFYLPSSAYRRTIKTAISYMEDNYQERITLEDISKTVNLSPSHFQKIFSKTMEQSPNEYLNQFRLTKAKEALLVTNAHITEIAFKHGFESNAYFCYVFKKAFHITPSLYRKSHQKPV